MNSPLLAVDAVIFLEDGSVVLVRRGNPPFQGWWALPGGGCEVGETVEQALQREVEEETGLIVEPVQLIGIFSEPDRDPRGHVVSIAFIAKPTGGQLRAGSDAANVQAFLQVPQKLAFDHKRILSAAREVRDK
ncbi:MAG: NUDIX domain-containing protein [Promethearchaeota archaeon]